MSQDSNTLATPPLSGSAFQDKYFTLTPEEARKQGPYDIIIVGSGFGGGVLGADIFQTNEKIGPSAQKVLLIERGNLIFHSNCLNAARPTSGRTGRDQFNHTFYTRFKSEYQVADASKADWGGGPVYTLGGRGSVWSLAAPRIHDKTLAEHFPNNIVSDLVSQYYQKAERLFKLFLPRTRPEHQEYMDRLNLTADGKLDVSWQWARIASEFSDGNNFDFAQGAFSPIDNLVEIAMNKPEENGKFQEHDHFKILLDTEVREIVWADKTNKRAKAVRARIPNGTIDFELKPTGRLVLSAGSVHSPAILLRSHVDLASKGGLHITDHTILYTNQAYTYDEGAERESIKSMKLQTYVNLLPVELDIDLATPPKGVEFHHALVTPGEGADKLQGFKDITLANLYVDAAPFLERGTTSNPDSVPRFVMIFVMRNPLEQDNTITLDSQGEPVVKIRRNTYQKDVYGQKLKEMEKFTQDAKKVTSEVLKAKFVPDDPPRKDYFDHLLLGAGGHEMGSIPIGKCIDEELKLLDCENIHVCDNSIFPFCPEVNPSLTLSALAIRLSRTLVPRKPVKEQAAKIFVVNHFRAPIKVTVGRHDIAGNMTADAPKPFEPGHFEGYDRTAEEIVIIYKPDYTKDQSKGPVYLSTPECHIGRPGKVLAIN